MSPTSLLHLLNLASPALPVGAYSYSDGLEALVARGAIATLPDLTDWLDRELANGSIRLDAAIMVRAWQATHDRDPARWLAWDRWLSAARETEELREQSRQMGRSLWRLLGDLLLTAEPVEPHHLVEPTGEIALIPPIDHADRPDPTDRAQKQALWQILDRSLREAASETTGPRCHFATAFGTAAALWQIDRDEAILAYLHAWATNVINSGIKLIPLGQTDGQRVLQGIYGSIGQAATAIDTLTDDNLEAWTWGLSLASMAHEVQYSRLFRS